MESYKNTIICGETVMEMRKMPDGVFDFCFADPPYFLQVAGGKKLVRFEGTEVDGCDDEWDRFESMDSYKEFSHSWLSEVRRVLKDDGSICVISGMQSVYEIGSILRDLGFWVLNDIVWKKANPTPNFSGSRLNNSHETLIWAAKSKKSRFTFNYKTGKYLNGGKQMGSVWTFPVCSGSERIRDDNGEKLHSTQKPEALLKRVIVLFTKPGDLILDPFGGTMTTGAVAKQCGRDYCMIEMEERYIAKGRERIEKIVPCIGTVESAVMDEKPARASFSDMTDAGYFIIGETFYHRNGKTAVLVQKAGKLLYEGEVDSMHEVAAKMSGAVRRVNAFDYFSVERDGVLVPIREIRENYRRDMQSRTGG